MNNKAFRFMFVLLFLFMIVQVNAKDHGKKSARTMYKPNGSPSWTHFNINNISTWFADNGDSDINPITAMAGFVFPKGSNKTAVFESGLVYAGKIKGQIRVAGSTYGSGMVPGAVINGVPQDPSDPSVHIYRVRPDWKTGDISSELNDGEGTAAEIRKQYGDDWNDWPVKLGAPYKDVNHDGKYEPSVDIPGFPGASQTLWYVANDFDTTQSEALYGSKGLSIEMQVTIWGYKSTSALGDMLFRKYRLINKGQDTIKDMYVSMWSDVDDGDAGDDYNGNSIPLSLYFTYNGKAIDAVYGSTPPAVGFDFFQGPIILGDSTDKAIFNNKIRMGYKNLPMTAFYYFINGDSILTDPTLGDYSTGALEFYNLMQGLISSTGAPYIDPLTGKATKYPLSGNPVTGKGWIDGMLNPPGDRRGGMVSGPFTMAVGDTQEVVVAEIASFGKNNLDAITKLKITDYYAQQAYNNLFKVEKIPLPPSVSPYYIEDSSNVTIAWNDSTNIESFDEDGFKFEGYNIYQLPSPDLPTDKSYLIKTYDKIDGIKTISQLEYDPNQGRETMQKVQFGTDSGLKHSFKIEKDYLNNSKLLIGKTYYFGVTAYTYRNDNTKKIKTSESLIKIIKLVYMNNYSGPKYGNLINVKHVSGNANSKNVIVSVYDVTKITGQKYTISFFKVPDSSSVTHYKMLWRLTNENGKVLVDSASQMSYDDAGIIVDGFLIKVIQIPTIGISSWDYSGDRWISGVNWGGSQFFGGMDLGMNFFGSTIKSNWPAVQLLWAGDTLTNITDHSAAALAAASQKQFPNRWSKGAEYRRDQDYGFGGIGEIPFAAYDVSVPNKPRRLNICFVEDANNGSANLLFDMGWDGTQFAGLGGREYLFIMNSTYDEGKEYDNTNWAPTADVLYAIWPSARGSMPYLLAPFEMNIYAYRPYTENDIFEFNSDDITVVKDSKEIPRGYSLSQNYPNPFNPTTTINYTIRKEELVKLKIYDILGREVTTLVNKVQKAGNYKVNFNASNLSSGVYFYRLQSGEFVKTKKMILLK